MSLPIPYWKSDPDYYSNKDPNRDNHRKRISINNYVDKLINLASLDGSYSILVKKDKDV